MPSLRTINGFRLAPWASAEDVEWARTHQIDVRRSAASQNWGADSRPSDAVVYASSASVTAIPPAPYQTPHVRSALGQPRQAARPPAPAPGWVWIEDEYFSSPDLLPVSVGDASSPSGMRWAWRGIFEPTAIKTPGYWAPPGTPQPRQTKPVYWFGR